MAVGELHEEQVNSGCTCVSAWGLGVMSPKDSIMVRLAFLALAFLAPALTLGQVPFPDLPQPVQSFSFEEKDWGVEPTTTPKRSPYHAQTPTKIPGARVIRTLELKALLTSNKDVVVIDVLDPKSGRSIPGAFWMSGAGRSPFYRAEKMRFAAALETLTGGDRKRPIVFLCLNSECWLSYNASLYAVEAGYEDVIWYRGGAQAWTGASLESRAPQSVDW